MVRSAFGNRRFLHAVGLVFLASCSSGGGEDTGTDPPAGPSPVSSVSVSPATATLNVGEATQLTATLSDAAGATLTGRSVTWSSSNSALASVSSAGQVTGLSGGTAMITATAEGKSGTASVTVVSPPVSSVTISPDPGTAQIGQTAQLTATAKDAQGQTLTGKTFTWASGDDAIATVNSTGLVSGVSAGTVQITASSEGVPGSGAFNVTAPSALVISSVSPDPLIQGQTATITGSGFSATTGSNAVMIDGQPTTVVAATTTQLTVTVPSACVPARSVQVQVTTDGAVSNALSSDVHPDGFIQMQVGDHQLIPPGGDLCLQFDQATNDEQYLFGITSVSDVISTLTPLRVSAASGNLAASPFLASAEPPRTLRPPEGLSTRSVETMPQRWIDHAVAEREFMDRARRVLTSGLRDEPVLSGAQSLRVAHPTIPGTATVGEQFPFKFPDFSGSFSTDFKPITVVVMKVSNRAIFVEDTANPVSIPSANYDAFAVDFDDIIFPQTTSHFGDATDADGNQRLIVLVTKEVNELATPPLAFVSAADLFPATTFAASNEAEVYYARAPDPDGTFNAGAYSLQTAINDFRSLLAHEFTHVIQGGVRKNGGGHFMESWVAESGATAAEEIVGFAFEGRSDGQNLGASQAIVGFGGDPSGYYRYIGDLATYFGNGAADPSQTPEQCSWVNVSGALPGPCDPTFGNRLPYGVPWSLTQYWIQRKGLSKAAVHRAITSSQSDGFVILESVFGETMSTLLGDWAPMLYLDDQPGLSSTTFSRFQLTNFDLNDIVSRFSPNALLRPRARSFSGFADNIAVRAASSAYYLINGANRSHTAVAVTDQNGNAPLPIHQVFIVRLR